MQSKILLAALIAGALGAPAAVLAGSDSYGSASPSAGSSMSGDSQAQGSSVPGDASAQSSGNGPLAQNGSCGDSRPKADCPQSTPTPSESQSEQGGPGGNDQYAQNDGDSTLSNTPGDPSSSPSGSSGDASMRQASSTS
jgi:hypothetical protein